MRNDLQINQESKNRDFFNFWAKYYDKEKIFSKLLFNIVKKTVNSVKIKNGSKILDIGCGTGNLLFLLEKQNKELKLYGIDVSEKMLKIAKKKVKGAVLMNISASYIDKKFTREFFDYIFIVDVFHHIPEKEKLMKVFYKILKKNGKLIITDFDFGIILNKIFRFIEPGNTGIYTKKQMRALFTSSRFSFKKQKKFGLFSVMTVGDKIKY